jgi:hypothetical protein
MDQLTMMMLQKAMQNGVQPPPSMTGAPGPSPLMASMGGPPATPGMPPSGPTPGMGMGGSPTGAPADPIRSQMPTPQSTILAPPAREPGHVKRMLMDFMYGGAQALKKMSGMPTDEELQQQDFKNRMMVQDAQQRSQLQQAQIQNYAADNARQLQEAEDRRTAAVEAQRMKANDPKNWDPDKRDSYGRAIGLKGDAFTRFKATGEFPSDYGKNDPNVTESELALRAASGGPDSAAARQALGLIAQTNRAGRSVTNISTGMPDAAIGDTPLTNPNEEKIAQMRARGQTSDDQIKLMYRGTKSNAPVQRIMLRVAALSKGNVNDAMSPAGSKVVADTMPTLSSLDSVLSDIKRLGLEKNNSRGYLAGSRLAYATGKAAPEGALAKDISGLELDRILAATSILKGSSRAYPALEKALVHTPNPWIDSPQLIHDKLMTIRNRLRDVINDARRYQTKSGLPNMDTPDTAVGADVPPPTADAVTAPAAGGWDAYTPKTGRPR